MARTWVLCVALLGCWLVGVHGGSVCDGAKIQVLNEINTIQAAAGDTTGTTLGQVLDKLCESAPKQAMVNIQTQIGTCMDLLNSAMYPDVATALNSLKIDGRSFMEFIVIFESVDEVCNCKTYLDDAFKLRTYVQFNNMGFGYVREVQGGYFQYIGNPSTVCNIKPFPVVIDKEPRNLMNALLAVDDSKCTNDRLAKIADLDDEMQMKNISDFADIACDQFNQDKFDCIVNATKKVSFTTCMAATVMKVVGRERMCSRRMCLKTAATNDNCVDEAAMRNFIFAVNILQNNKDKMIEKTEKECENAAASIQMSVLGVLLAVFVSMLK